MTSSPIAPSALTARIARATSSASERKSPTSAPSSAARRQRGGNGACDAPRETLVGRNRLGETFDNALRRQRASEAEQTRPLAPTHAKISESQREHSRAVDLRRRGRLEPNCIEGERSNQIQTVCAASHSRSRTKARSSRAERRQSTRDDGSPDRKGRNCQKVSPEPRAAPAVNAVTHRLGDATRSDDEAGQTGRERRRVAADRDGKRHVAERPLHHWIVLATSRPITAEMVSPSARAAKLSAMRCLSAGSAKTAISSREGDRRPSTSARARAASMSA